MRTPCALDLSENWFLETKRQHSRNLRSLVLVNTLVPQENLEDLISISLGLEEFKLMLCGFHSRSPLDFDAKRFYKHLQSLPLSDLEAFQFLNKDSQDLSPSESELICSIRPRQRVFRRCTSGLASTREEPTPMKPTVSVFGYIARVRPLLQDLVIYGPESRPITRGVSNLHETLGLDLPNGLCILSNLKHLRHLQIGERYMEISVKSIDVDWMLPSGYSEDKVLERKKAMARWVDMVQNDLRLLSLDLTSVRQLAGGVLDIPELEPELAFKL
ncbi:hypothetical protein BGX29_004131 [Mortierella sp. GBA35]|nr:hypothetical protein BGX29_004131 [Mortierella sp. GBA35]